jgi:hypothetical protein
MKAVNANPHPKPERKPDSIHRVGETVLSVYHGQRNVEVFQERDGHTQRLQLTQEQWKKFKEALPS